MSMKENDVLFSVSDDEIEYLNKSLESINTDISVSMSYVKRAQKLTFSQLTKRFSGMSEKAIKRYLQQSYPSMRPIHFVAAYSWVMMVPMMTFGFKMKDFGRGMDGHVAEVLVCTGQLPAVQFNALLDILCSLMDSSSVLEFIAFKQQTEAKYGIIEDYNSLFPPKVLDIHSFAEDYYYSVALTVKQFREKNQIPVSTLAKVLGLSEYQYSVLEDETKTVPFSISIGARIKLGFKLETHADFTREMRVYPEFYKLRQAQHIRYLLVVQALSCLSFEQRKISARLVTELLDLNQLSCHEKGKRGRCCLQIPTIFS